MNQTENKNKTVNCPVPGCAATGLTSQGIAVHCYRTHKRRLSDAEWNQLGFAPRYMRGGGQEQSSSTASPAPSTASGADQTERHKRRSKQTTLPTVSFCPCCGTNLKAVAIALTMKG
jgi:hypothetical protein